MKRMIFNLSIAFIAFCIGVAAELAFQKYLEVPFPSICETPLPSSLARLAPVPEESQARQLSVGSLPAELQRIDQKYQRQCRIPTHWHGGWPTVKQLDSYSKCSDEWAMARRNAIQYERTKYLVIY